MITLDDLIRYGYFPRELVPPFNTSKLADNLANITKLKTSSHRHSKSCAFTIPRLRNLRRSLGIPNPNHQVRLCSAISTHWSQINSVFAESRISLSRPTEYSKGKEADKARRALIPSYEFSRLQLESALRSTGSRYLLTTDISRYYSTIYTHSIPWAIHGKSAAKKDHSSKQYGNIIDTLVRNTQDSQTIGIPIGPDTSLVVSEIIGTAIDLRLQSEIKTIRGYRYIDDFKLFFSELSEAENALHLIHSTLKDFELEINPTKTSIVELPEVLTPFWVRELRFHRFRRNQKAQENDIIDYFSKAFEYSKKFPDDNVLKYALRRMRNILVYPDNWRLYESLIYICMSVNPSVIPTAIETLVFYREKERCTIDYNKLSNTISSLLTYHAKYKNDFELAWTLFLAKSLDIMIEANASQCITLTDNPIVSLTSLDLQDKGYFKKKIDTSKWESVITRENLYSNQWLFVYEASKKNWFNKSRYQDIISEDDFFSFLLRNDIDFYDPSIEVQPYEMKDDPSWAI